MKFIKQVAFILIIALVTNFAPVSADAVTDITLSAQETSIKAGSSVTLEVNISSQSEIGRARIFVNDIFVATLHNPGMTFTYNYVTSRDANGTLAFKVLADDLLGQSTLSNIVNVAVSSNTETVITFKDVPEKVKYDELSEIKAEVIDADGVEKAELYINNELSDAQLTTDGNVYTFTDFSKNLGEMNFTLKVTDDAGTVTSANKKVQVENRYIAPLFPENSMDSVPGGMFKINAANGYTFATDKYTDAEGKDNKFMKITRASTPDAKTSYFRYQVRDGHGNIDGVFEVEFDLKISSDAYNDFLLNFNPRGNKEPITPIIYGGGTIELKNGTNTADTKTLSNYFDEETWYHLKYICDTNKKTYRFFVDDIELTSEGEYKLPIEDNETMGYMVYIAMNIRLPEQNDSLGIDNVKFSCEKKQADVENAIYSDGVLTATVKDGLADEGISENVSIVKDGKIIPLSSVLYNSETKLLTLTPKTQLDSSNEYVLVIKSGSENADGKILSVDSYTSFLTPSVDFDIKNVIFDEYAGGKGVKAIVSNSGSDAQTILMVMTVKNKLGAVEGVYSSDEITISSGQMDVSLNISPVFVPEDGTVEVFFLNGWLQSKAIKKFVFKK